ncbi:uncharacterized protein [Amphiura filiformis]|uniref:uncharacterized protein n=1 Tax=Amphiura filiformis TaxID=82378 RepID=UPI003B214452
MAKLAILTISLLVAMVNVTSAQIPIPNRPLGFQYGSKGQSLIQLDAFMDLACPDSKRAFPTLKEVADHYGVANLRLNVVMFPLPYHRSAWLTTQSTFIINGINSDATFKWMADFYAVQEKFFNSPTMNMSDTQIMSLIADVAGNVVDRSTFLSKLLVDEGDSDARTMWKYSCSRTISGTPQILVNGVGVDASLSWTLDDWMKVIDPLLGKKITRKSFNAPNCPSGTKSCEYLPRQYQCCTTGENCIPNVGCRC